MAPLTEKERQALLSHAVNCAEMAHIGCFTEKEQPTPEDMKRKKWFDAEFIVAIRERKYKPYAQPRIAASLILVAVCDETFVRKSAHKEWNRTWSCPSSEHMIRVLDDRRPAWLAKHVQDSFGWFVHRGLIRSGALELPTDASYFAAMAEYPFKVTAEYSRLPAIIEKLFKDDPDLGRTDVFGLFEHNTGFFHFSHSPWFKSLPKLCKKGIIDREKLLEATAKGMGLSLKPGDLGGFAKLHESLGPTLAERERLTEPYLTALGSEHATMVGAALKALEILAKAKKLNASAFVEHGENALRVPKKAQSTKSIKLIQTLVKQQPESASAATEALTVAVTHERPDVQETAISALEKLRGEFTPTTLENLNSALDLVASVHRSRLQELLEPDEASQTNKATKQNPPAKKKTKTAAGAQGDTAVSEIAELTARLQAIPDDIRAATAADATIAGLSSESPPAVVSIRPGDVPRRDSDQTVQPIESVEELIDTVATVIEGVEDAMEIERIVDGMSRFRKDRPDDFEKRVAPLRKRIQKLNEPYAQNVITAGAEIGFSQLLVTWLEMEPIRRECDDWGDLSGLFFRSRCGEIFDDRRPKRQAACRLALPTHAAGWIDPEILVKRIESDYLERRECTDGNDLTQAILRLTPDGRAAALRTLTALPGDDNQKWLYGGGPQLDYALGGAGDFSRDTEHSFSWIRRKCCAAVHARMTIEDAEAFVPPFPVTKVSSGEDFRVRIDGPFMDDPSVPVRLSVMASSLCNTGAPELRDSEWIHDLEAMIFPADPTAMLMLGRIDGVFDCDFSWSKEAARLVVFASSSSSKEFRMKAADAFIDAFAQVRASPELVGQQMAGLGEHLTLKRTAEALASVGQVSELHQASVFRTIHEFISCLDSSRKDLHFALTPMLEAALQSGFAVEAGCRQLLESVSGSSKTAKLAKQILQIEPDHQKQMVTRVQAATAVVERAERWQRIATS